MWDRWFSQRVHRPGSPCTTSSQPRLQLLVMNASESYRRSSNTPQQRQPPPRPRFGTPHNGQASSPQQQHAPPRPRFGTPRGAPSHTPSQQSSWSAKEAGGGRHEQADYLYELGASQQYNINVTHGQSLEFIDSLFTGNTLGHQTDIADGSLRGYEFRQFANIVGDYYVAPRFLDAVCLHITKNYLCDQVWSLCVQWIVCMWCVYRLCACVVDCVHAAFACVTNTTTCKSHHAALCKPNA